jgi:hypothetical protein
MGYAGKAHKILGGLVRKNESTVIYGTLGMALGMADLVAVQRGSMIKTENTLFQKLYESVGHDSLWTKYHRSTLGLERYIDDVPVYVQRGAAALHLYQETARVLRPILRPNDLEVVDSTIGIIERSGFL